jgi:hypothetical protein
MGGDFLVSPGTGASGAAALYNAVLNNLTFAVSGATGISGATGAANLSINVTSGPSGPVVTFDASRLTQVVNNLMVTQTYDPNMPETATGATYQNKPVYRRAWKLQLTANPGSQINTPLITTDGYVDSIVNSGGYFTTGNGSEKYNIPSTLRDFGTNWVAGYPLVDASNRLILSTVANPNRVNNDAFVWVDYTKQ